MILRGALDGLATVAPIGDPDYAGAPRLDRADARRTACRRSRSTPSSGCIRRCRNSRGCIAHKQAAVIHAVSTPYRDRSHFDGQDVLESGYAGPGRVQSGWLNRALEASADAASASTSGARGRPDHAAGAARRRADRRLGAGRAAAGRRRHRDAAARSLSPSRSGAGHARCRRACSSRRPRTGDDMKPKPGGNARRGDAQVARGAAQSDGRRRRAAHRRARLRRLGHACQ